MSQQIIPRKRIESLYVLKAICAFFVVSIHVPLAHDLLYPIAGVGTPCFLCITGYLLYSASQERELRKCLSWAQKSFWLAVVCNIIYSIATYFIHGVNVLTQGWWFFVENFLFGTNICRYLWYLTALWQALLVLRFFIKWMPKLIKFLPILFIGAYLLRNHNFNSYIDAGFNVSNLRLTWLFTSLPCLATGYLIHQYHQRLLSALKINVWLIVALVLNIVEFRCRLALGVCYSHHMFFTWPLAVLLMLLCVKYPDFSIPVVDRIGRKHSPNIYYFHGLFIWGITEVGVPEWNILVLTACIYCACIPCSFVYNYLSERWKMYIWLPLLQALSQVTGRLEKSEL